MDIDENAPGNISQCPATRSTDNETGFDPASDQKPGKQPVPNEVPSTPPIDQGDVKPVPGEVI